MWNLFRKKEKPVSVNIAYIASQMNQRMWSAKVTSANTISIEGRYRNNERSFERLVLHFEKNCISFKDPRGSFVTGVEQHVSRNEMYGTVKNILNVI